MNLDYNHSLETLRATGIPGPNGDPYFIGGVYAKEFHISAGCLLLSHQHVYDHMSILAQGRAIVRTPEGNQELTGPAVINIKAGIEHSVESLTDIVWFCIHAVDIATEAYQKQDPHSTDGLLIIKTQ